MKPLAFDPEALAELKEAARYLDLETQGTGERLRAAVDRALMYLNANPQHCPPLRGTPYRKRRVPRFSYMVYFLELPEFIWIAAVSHTSRRPDYWSDRRPPS